MPATCTFPFIARHIRRFVSMFNPFQGQWFLCVSPGITFKRSTFCPQSVFVFVWTLEKQLSFPYTIMPDWVLHPRQRAFTALLKYDFPKITLVRIRELFNLNFLMVITVLWQSIYSHNRRPLRVEYTGIFVFAPFFTELRIFHVMHGRRPYMEKSAVCQMKNSLRSKLRRKRDEWIRRGRQDEEDIKK
jgi:hypothetical protein